MKVVKQDSAENCNFLLCIKATDPQPSKDNERGECCECGVAVTFRPTAPRKPKRICIDCALEQGVKREEICVTETTVQEVKRHGSH